MKGKIFLSIALCAGILAGCSTSRQATQTTVNQKIYTTESDTILIGRMTREALSNDTLFNDWYLPTYKKYQPNPKIIQALSKFNINRLSIEIFLGTWCSDSQNQVPPFIKILDDINFPENRVTMYATDQQKKTHYNEEKHKNIVRVPTFIVYEGNKEIGRIIEHPDSTLEYDLYKIFKKIH